MNSQFQVVVPQGNQVDNTKNLLYVSDLPQNISEEDLWFFFGDYKNNIVVINLNTSSKFNDYTNQRPSNATIIFKDFKVADEARKQLNMRKIKGKTIRIMWHERDNSVRYNPATNVFVKNIPFNVKPRDVYEQFLQYGDIVSAKVPEDEEGNHLGYGYINYYDADSANKAISATDGKELWDSTLEVNIFQKKNERLNSFGVNSNIYLKNLPSNYSDEELRKICSKYGEVLYCKIMHDSNQRPYAIVSYKDEDTAFSAKNSLNGQNIGGDQELFVDTLMPKQERKKFLSNKINDSNYRLNEQYKYCNLHIRNIPYNAKEEDLIEAFKPFGEIKSVKIDKYILMTKDEKNELKEILASRGFGYVCFETPESAKEAIETMTGKFLPKFETWKRPLLVDYFMPKQERKGAYNKANQFNPNNPNKMNMFNMNPMMQSLPQMGNPMMMPYGNQMMNPQMNMNPQMMGKQKYPQMMNPQMMNMGYMNQQPPQQHNTNTNPNFNQKKNVKNQQPQNIVTTKTTDDIDYQYLDSLEDDYAKKDYLGEFIFKKIENHKLSQMHNFTIDTIGKITGMILGIEDINEIVDICRDSNNLTARISEALELLDAQGQKY